MNVSLGQKWEHFVADKVNSGDYQTASEVLRDGLRLLEKVVSTYKDFPATYFYLGLGNFDAGKPKEALVALEKARDMHPEPELAPRVEYELSRVYRKLGRIEDSNKAIHEFTRLKAQNAKLNPAVLSAISAGFGTATVPSTVTKGKN